MHKNLSTLSKSILISEQIAFAAVVYLVETISHYFDYEGKIDRCHRGCSIKEAFRKNFAIFKKNHKKSQIHKKSLFKKVAGRKEEHLRMAASEMTLGRGLFWTFFLESRFQNYPDLVILQKYQLLSNQNPL